MMQYRTLYRSMRAFERMAEDPDQDRARLELRERVTHPLGARERVVLVTAFLEARSSREVVVGSERDDEDVGVVRLPVRCDETRLRFDGRDTLSPELDPLSRHLRVVEEDVLLGFTAEEDVELRESEMERVVLVDERDADLVDERLGEACRKLQAGEACSQYHHVLRQPVARRYREAPGTEGSGERSCRGD